MRVQKNKGTVTEKQRQQGNKTWSMREENEEKGREVEKGTLEKKGCKRKNYVQERKGNRKRKE